MGRVALVASVTSVSSLTRSAPIVDRVTNTAFETANRARRYHRLELIVIGGIAGLVILALAIALFFGLRQNDNREDTKAHTDCIVKALTVFIADHDAPGGASVGASRDEAIRSIDACP